MLTIISAIVVFLGSLNWFFIGVLQYDFVAGLFGFQASLFSRLVYFIIGMCAFYLVFFIIKNRKIFQIYQREKLRKTKNENHYEEKEKSHSERDWDFDVLEDKENQKVNQKKYKDFDASKYD